MSNFYDSLEEESEDDKFSLESLNEGRAKSSNSDGRLYSRGTTDNYSFFLNEKTSEEKFNLLPIFQSCQTKSEGKNFLPKIDICPKKKNSHILKEQGLMLNDDGSFTKSPRPPEENLPFITREYRNLQFQKKKTWTVKHTSAVKAQKKNIFSFKKNPIDGNNMNEPINTRKKQKAVFSEEILMNEGSLRSKSQEKPNGTFEKNYNMTDSMKEKLLETLGENRTTEKSKESIGKNLVETCELSKQKKIPLSKTKTETPSKENLFKEPQEKSAKNLVGDTRKPKNVCVKIPKHRSDILIKIPKPKLSYSEQHQLKKGYNPFSLKHTVKGVQTDTNRSTFGDSVVEGLSEVSSRFTSCRNLDNEDEENFYMEFIEMDKRRTEIQCSARSDGPYQPLPLKNLCNYSKNQKEVLSGKSYGRYKPASKSLSIDLPCDADQNTKTLQKCPHYCSVDSSRTSSKVELALKARTYGYLANARNIFKLKAQSEAKFNDFETEKSLKNNKKTYLSPKKALGLPLTNSKLLKQNSLPVNGLSAIKKESVQNNQNLTRASASWCKAKQPEKPQTVSRGEDFALSKVKNLEVKISKMSTNTT